MGVSQPSTTVSRLGEKQSTSRRDLDAVLDASPLATIALVRDGHPVVFPTGFVRVGDDLVIHGSTGSPWMRALAAGSPAAVSVTTLDGVVVARSAFESSFRYRSAVVFGAFATVPAEQKVACLDAITEKFIPGRVTELRSSTRKELAATLALRLPIDADNWSLKISEGWPEDPDEDVAGDSWAGVVPMAVTCGIPLPAPDLRPGIAVPDSVRTLAGG
ncbi:putative flavin-nucleotide-binding protein [Mycolicibacterium chubuense NBB4]|uniref:Putative flavin-nucleotide-binding protein n=1 Tax=Mycolicibacterium chubuense (strain NBB4) TaxID=710421 RepID=I4BDN1_MYCCN|nr:pyridoxamine 5'-phosphate oxidase family protein [Mycolicibacterium chubuense]AFM15388.1 putative flavin-nucleotide-binding protein [Mycolicibacterium chubuense NBB4]